MYRTYEGVRQQRISLGGNANIIDQDYADNPSEQGANMYISEQNYQSALMTAEALEQNRGYGTEPPEYRFDYYDHANNRFVYAKPYCAGDVPCYDSQGNPTQGAVLVGWHMPYMRWWDTGISADDSGNRGTTGIPLQRHGGSFLNTLGGDIAIVGVGRPERSGADAYLASLNPLIGPQYQTANEVQNVQQAQMGRVGGWPELKAWEALVSIRRNNDFCIGRYEKMGKYDGPENFVLAKAGASYTTMGDSKNNIPSQQVAWSLGWQGYVTDSHAPVENAHEQAPRTQFPIFGQGLVQLGLDNAQVGDIIIYSINGPLSSTLDMYGNIITYSSNGLNQIAYVVDAQPPGAPQYITVLDWDQGKFPTSTGSGVMWGQGMGRTIFKSKIPQAFINNITGTNPNTGQPYHQLYALAGSNPSCEDPDYLDCVLPNNQWSSALVYRPSDAHNLSACIVPPQWSNVNFGLSQTLNFGNQTIGPFNLLTAFPLSDTYYWLGPTTQPLTQTLLLPDPQLPAPHPRAPGGDHQATTPMLSPSR